MPFVRSSNTTADHDMNGTYTFRLHCASQNSPKSGQQQTRIYNREYPLH
jgi:hypothetical protein